MSYQDIQEIPSIPEIDQLLESNDFQDQNYATLDLSCFDFVRDGHPGPVRDGHSAPVRDGHPGPARNPVAHDSSESNVSSEDEATNTESSHEDYDEDVEVLVLSAKNLGIAN